MNSELLQQTINNLGLHQVSLRSVDAHVNEQVSSVYADTLASLEMQIKHRPVSNSLFKAKEPSGEEIQFTSFAYECGVRLIDSSRDDSDSLYEVFKCRFIFSLELKVMSDELPSEEGLAEFAYYNVPFIVWPYWREALSSLLERSGMPRFTLPFFRVNELQAENPLLKVNEDV
ncbi:MAG: hypothetical protein K6L73_06150 [Cellvibrionaceae bacterium]